MAYISISLIKKKINENKIEVNTTNWIWFELQGILLFNSNSMEGL